MTKKAINRIGAILGFDVGEVRMRKIVAFLELLLLLRGHCIQAHFILIDSKFSNDFILMGVEATLELSAIRGLIGSKLPSLKYLDFA